LLFAIFSFTMSLNRFAEKKKDDVFHEKKKMNGLP